MHLSKLEVVGVAVRDDANKVEELLISLTKPEEVPQVQLELIQFFSQTLAASATMLADVATQMLELTEEGEDEQEDDDTENDDDPWDDEEGA